MNRKDGTKVKTKGMFAVMTFVMPKRCDSDVYINTKVDVTELIKYYEKLHKKEETSNITFFHLFAMASGKLFYNKDRLNNFIINKNMYHRNTVSIGFVAKKEFKDESEELWSKIIIEPDDNIFTLSNKISGQVKNVRNEKENSVDKLIDNLGKLPKFLRWLIFKILIFADNHDLLPEDLTNNSIYHSSLLMSNIGSIGCDGAIYHHLTDFGTNGILMTIGKIKDEPVVIDGKVEIRKMCEFGFNLDERIADGFYFIKSLEILEYIINNPKLLEDPANTKIEIKKEK